MSNIPPIRAGDRRGRLLALGAMLWLLACRYQDPGQDAGADMARVRDLSNPVDGLTGACSIKSCAGCCMGDTCLPGTANNACGKMGDACSVCNSGYQWCLVDQHCGLDPNQMWLLAALDATINPMMPNGSPWNSDGTPPDPAVSFTPPGSKLPPLQDTYSPMWGRGFTFTARQLTTSGVTIQVLDDDGATTQAISGPHTLVLTEADFARGKLNYSGWEGVMRISFVLQKQ